VRSAKTFGSDTGPAPSPLLIVRGATALTRIPCGANSNALALVRCASAAFEGPSDREGIRCDISYRSDVDDGARTPTDHSGRNRLRLNVRAYQVDLQDAGKHRSPQLKSQEESNMESIERGRHLDLTGQT
jgi:hypothetical protein